MFLLNCIKKDALWVVMSFLGKMISRDIIEVRKLKTFSKVIVIKLTAISDNAIIFLIKGW